MRLLAALLLAVVLASPVRAQPEAAPGPVDPDIARIPELDQTETMPQAPKQGGESGFTPFVAPVPFKNSQIGWGGIVLIGAIHRLDADTTSKPSTGGVGGFYSENRSWGVMAMELARFGGDAWRARGFVSHMEVHYDFFGIGEDAGSNGRSVAIDQTMDFAVASGLRRISSGFYAGAAITWMRTTATPDVSLPPEFPPLEGDFSRATLVAPGLQAEIDTRDDNYWPRHGSFARLKGWFFSDALGSTREFQRYAASWSSYREVGRRGLVLATNLNTQAVGGDAPFYALPSIGTGEGALRGYQQGRYRDELAVTAQAEVRYHSKGRFGATVFGGLGAVAPEFGDLGDAQGLPAGGAGLRFQLTRNFPMHLRADYAWGRDGGILYFSVAEAF